MIPYRSPGLLALLAFALLSLAGLPARAERSIGVVVSGEATMQPQLVAQLETWLRSHGYDLVSASLPPDAINALIDCFVVEDQVCARRVVEKRAKSKAVLFAQVSVSAGATALDRTVTLTGYWISKDRDAITERRSCERCTDVTMRTTADSLLEALDDASSVHGTVKLTSTPPGATVTIDGRPAGKTPLTATLAPGEHKLAFEYAGHYPETRSVTVKKDVTESIGVAMVAKPNRVPGYLFLGAGVALAAAGGVLIAINEPVPTDPSVKTYRDTLAGGIALAATGGVALGFSVYLLTRPPKKSSVPVAGLVRGGALLGWAGRF